MSIESMFYTCLRFEHDTEIYIFGYPFGTKHLGIILSNIDIFNDYLRSKNTTKVKLRIVKILKIIISRAELRLSTD